MKKSLILLIAPLLLVGCATKEQISSNFQSSDASESVEQSSSSSSSSDDESSEKSSEESSISSEESGSSSSSSSEEEGEYEQYVPEQAYGHYLTMGLPKNHGNPEQLVTTLSNGNDHISTNVFDQELPEDFRYAYTNSYDDGPSGKRASPNFYSAKDGGGLKLAKEGLGFQTREFTHTGEKLEVRMEYKLYAASGKPNKSDDTAHIYAYNNKGQLLGFHAIPKETLQGVEQKKTYTFYWTTNAKETAYFEFRLLANPYKTDQKYNLQVMQFNYISWERA